MLQIINHLLCALRLFQQFFRSGTYWQDSLLARYTLAQTVEEAP